MCPGSIRSFQLPAMHASLQTGIRILNTCTEKLACKSSSQPPPFFFLRVPRHAVIYLGTFVGSLKTAAISDHTQARNASHRRSAAAARVTKRRRGQRSSCKHKLHPISSAAKTPVRAVLFPRRLVPPVGPVLSHLLSVSLQARRGLGRVPPVVLRRQTKPPSHRQTCPFCRYIPNTDACFAALLNTDPDHDSIFPRLQFETGPNRLAGWLAATADELLLTP
ncbi:hypothetical protein IWZ00DRAFT_518100 [Phyllosticta capitalensis]